MARVWTADQIRALGVRTDLETAGSIFGIGRTLAYQLAKTDEFPTTVVKVRNRYVVPIAPILRALGVDDAEQAQETEQPAAALHALPHRSPPAA